VAKERRKTKFPIVALGASAGGLEALKAFFGSVPPDSGLGFVVVTHQAPGHTSLMADLLGRVTEMPVVEVKNRMEIEPNHVYTSAPGQYLDILHGALHSTEADGADTSPHLPVDYFFRSLAQDQERLAIGVVLSGTGTDGTLGTKEIKAKLGMVMVQSEDSAEHPGMPSSAISTGLADYVSAPSEMPEQLIAYAQRLRAPVLPAADSAEVLSPAESLERIFVILRNQTGHDFSLYKESTIRLHHIDELEDYVELLEAHPNEVELLFKELLIGVTSFFRDPDAFDALEPALAELLESKPEGEALRVWVAGCATGEEAFSMAILIKELVDKVGKRFNVQIFATDLDASAIGMARAGLYPGGIANDLSPERLKRFFTLEDEQHYRIRRDIREMVIFAEHNTISDPPFTKLDALVCRNLLIYLGADLQSELLPMFCYALKSEGILMLGPSESIGRFSSLFEVVDKRWKIFRTHDDGQEAKVPGLSADAPRPVNLRQTKKRPLAFDHVPSDALPRRLLLRMLVPPAVLVNERGTVVHVHGRTGRFLEPSPGSQADANVFSMARFGLQTALSTAVREAASEKRESVRHGIQEQTNGDEIQLDLRVQPVGEPEVLRGLFLVSFENARPIKETQNESGPIPPEKLDRVDELERALRYTKESHQATIEELETANEELKSTNEEPQSTNEELETSKEEMQSLNEELETVNTELQDKVEELSHINDDMNNLLNSTDIATIFLDEELNIKSYTKRADRVVSVIPSDVGRPLGDLVFRVDYAELTDDARDVMDSLVPKETEAHAEDGRWYLVRILPYRTTDNVIEGLVITFVDITRTKQLQENERLLFDALKGSPTMVFRQNAELRFTWAASAIFGREPREVVGKTDSELFGEEGARAISEVKRGVFTSGAATRQRVKVPSHDGDRWYDIYVEPIFASAASWRSPAS